MAESTVIRKATVQNPQGFHMRPWEQFATLAAKYNAKVQVINGNARADATSIINLMTLAVGEGTELVLEAVGPDAQQAAEALAAFVENIVEEDEIPDQEQPG